jgi:hypothetical protein
MKNLALLLLLAAPVAVHAQGLSLTAPGQSSGGKALWQAPFATPGCYASGQTAGASSAISITRTTKGTVLSGGSIVECNAGEFRVADTNGLLVEPARTQYVLNSGTHPKSAQATGTISAQACVGWHTGVGNMTIAAGTATATGLSCSAVAPGTLCTFTVTVAGTMLVTTDAGVTHAQIECPGSYKTSQINSAGTSTARNADQISATVPAVPANKWCWALTALPEEGRAWSTLTNANWLLILGTNGVSANDITWDTTRVLVRDSSGGVTIFTNSAHASNTAHRLVSCLNTGVITMSSDGTAVSLTKTGAGTGIQTTNSTTLRFGADNAGGNSFGGFIKNVSLWKASKTKEVK